MSSPGVFAAMLVLAVVTYAFKVVGPLTTSGRSLSPSLARVTEMLPTALIAGLVVTQTFDGGLIEAKVIGVLAAAVAVALGAPFAVVVLVGSVCAAGLRALGMS
jgi:uncharacterized membrane protein